MSATVVPIIESDIAAARALRLQFGRFWSTAVGTPREIYDQFIAATPIAEGVTRAEDPASPGLWCRPAEAQPGRAILFIHGGGYGLGHAGAYAGMVSQLAARTRVPAFALEYPLAPEATVPTARDLAAETLEHLAADFGAVAVVGDSAGGGLSFATVLEARRRGIPVAALATFSPWTDLSLSGDSAREFAVADPLLDVGYLRASAAAYLGAAPATDPRASPLFDPDLRLLPPTLIQVGTDEVLLDDSRRMAEAAARAGAEVSLEVWQGMHHVFQLNTAELASARQALDRSAAFLDRHWPS
ncbi:alpha/beta hydrolase fold domain-containing protein [Paucibacter sp. R3-3]|uniref:Alpha/beta hydrolase fold domain-containing protein n=1 Tax=Roseateles agri TaxID=3098619 RepID=A0ABU5DJY8_9BURK|nr:alpha/beta hydrolase fold domain-containing protein [Paucibacter sp. R3-3]MDY0746601.1 alpha/beta hydrolase fold domain-containing protein [Paucibacter sp. R3-3]